MDLPLPTPQFHGRSSLQGYLAHALCRRTLKPVLTHAPIFGPTLLALQAVERAARFIPNSRGVRIEPVLMDFGVCQLFTPDHVTSDDFMVYFHGGAFLSCGYGTHKQFMEQLALQEGMPVLAVSYRQYPQALLSVTKRDCLQAVDWVLNEGYDAHQIVLAGDSAGGALSLLTAGKLLHRGIKVKGVIALSGWLDFTTPQEAYLPYEAKDAYIPARRLPQVAKLILGREPKEGDSPTVQIAQGFPPLLLIAGANEVLRVDSERAMAKAQELGVACELHLFAGGIHAFPVLGSLFPEGRKAKALIHNFLAGLDDAKLDPAVDLPS